MKEKKHIISPRARNTFLVFHFECVPDHTVWGEEKSGAEVHCYLDRNINNVQELSEAETAAREFLAQSGWIVKELLGTPRWEKMPSRFRCFFSDVLTARRVTMEIARLDGIAFLAYSWKHDDNEVVKEK
ncbi:MAG: hypothetical protein IKD10_00220 [Lentisphaeria bacterium]|nr:hypothetical protein [Lentisphaeria bacterium]